jgi:DNA-binding NarL/FixJ family response regulator
LTEEEQVIDFLARGYTTDEITTASKSTTKNITKLLNSLLKKAGVVNRTELVHWWREY